MSIDSYKDESYILAQAFNERVNLTPNKIAYIEYDDAQKKWIEYSWLEIKNLAASIQYWLKSLGLQKGDRIALMLPNGRMWVAIDQAAAGLGIITVPLYPNDRENNVQYIIDNTDSRLLIVSSFEQYEFCKDFIEEISTLENLYSVDPIVNADIPHISLQSDSVEFQTQGCTCNEPATIVYTSGTTGRPKGVVLTHKNILSNAAACGRAFPVSEDDRLLSFLPLSHTFERTVGYYAPMLHGAEVAYARSIEKLADDLQIQQPTILISVPRIYERVYAKIEKQVERKSTIQKTLFEWTHSIGYRKFCFQQGNGPWSPVFILFPLLDKLVAKKIRDRLGGKLKFAVAGGAGFAKDLNEFFIGMGVNVVQGYGMTESSPVISANRIDKNIPGSVGPAFDNLEIKLSNVGELMVKGDSVMQGYWRNADATNEVLTDDGWLHTGDIAQIEDGFIYITGRVKDIIVLSNGEKIPPADIEHAISKNFLFDQVLVIGEGKPFLSAVVVLNPEQCELQGVDPDHLNDEAVKTKMLEKIGEHMHKFPGFAQIYQITATMDPWEVENGLLTPTLKVKREKVKALFEDEIEKMYEGH